MYSKVAFLMYWNIIPTLGTILHVSTCFSWMYCTEEMLDDSGPTSQTCHPPRFVHTSLTSTGNRQDGERAIDESADAAAWVDVLISSPPVCLITAVSGPGLPNCIQDHRVSLWWCERGKQRENQSRGTLLLLLYTKMWNVQTHTHTRRCLNIILFLIFSVGFIIFSLFSLCLALTHVITHTNPQLSLSLPLHDAGKRLEFIPAPLLIPPHSSRMHSTHTHTRTCSNTRTHNQQTCVMWLLSAWAAVEMKLC